MPSALRHYNDRRRARPGQGHRPERNGARRGSATWIVITALLLPIATVGSVAAWSELFDDPDERLSQLATVAVERGPLAVKVTEHGTLESSRNVTLRSMVEGGAGTRIMTIVEEGTLVTKGQVVAELDASTFEKEASKQYIAVESARAALKNAEASVAIQKMQNEADIATARLTLALGKLDLRKYTEADYVQEGETISGEIRMARENLTVAEENYRSTERMMRKGYASTGQLEANRVAVNKAQTALQVAREKMRVLVDYAHKRSLAEKEENAVRFGRELKRIEMRAQWALAQCQIEQLARRRTLAIEEERYARLQRQIEACTIRAPCDGLAVYTNTTNGGRASNQPLIYEGAMVRERQPVLHIPDLNQMQVNAQIHESKIIRVRAGLPAIIRVDARSETTFHGVVERVALVPISARWPNRDLKEYRAIIRITDDPAVVRTLRPGLTAEVEILVDRPEGVLQVPIQSVVEQGGRNYAWVVDDDQLLRRELSVGMINAMQAEVVEGLGEGDQIVLDPRTEIPDEIARLELEVPDSGRVDDIDSAPLDAPDDLPFVFDDNGNLVPSTPDEPTTAAPLASPQAGRSERRNAATVH